METVRFNVAGLVTQFKGRQYLLLQRAAAPSTTTAISAGEGL